MRTIMYGPVAVDAAVGLLYYQIFQLYLQIGHSLIIDRFFMIVTTNLRGIRCVSTEVRY